MSRAGKPTDNPVNEVLNGWIKEEVMSDYQLNKRTFIRIEGFRGIIDEYVKYYNECRPCYAIGYDTPNNYRRRFNKGELQNRNTFENRELTTIPKFVRNKTQSA